MNKNLSFSETCVTYSNYSDKKALFKELGSTKNILKKKMKVILALVLP